MIPDDMTTEVYASCYVDRRGELKQVRGGRSTLQGLYLTLRNARKAVVSWQTGELSEGSHVYKGTITWELVE